MRGLRALLVIVAAIVVLSMLGAIIASITDFKTKILTQEEEVTTVAASTANVTLDKGLWENTTAYADVTSSITTDNIVVSSYNSSTRQLTISGLALNTTRTLTIEYRTYALDSYTGVEEGVRFLPTALILGIITVALIPIVMAFRR